MQLPFGSHRATLQSCCLLVQWIAQVSPPWPLSESHTAPGHSFPRPLIYVWASSLQNASGTCGSQGLALKKSDPTKKLAPQKLTNRWEAFRAPRLPQLIPWVVSQREGTQLPSVAGKWLQCHFPQMSERAGGSKTPWYISQVFPWYFAVLTWGLFFLSTLTREKTECLWVLLKVVDSRFF